MSKLLAISIAIAAVHLTSVRCQNDSVGLNYGQLGNNLPSPAAVVALYKMYNLHKMRIFEPDPAVLKALRGSNIQVIVSTLNADIPIIAQSQSSAQSWFHNNIKTHSEGVSITHISIGNEVIPGQFASSVLPAMKNLHAVISAAGLQVKVTTAVSIHVFQNTYPPSSSTFSAPEMTGIVQFLQEQNADLLINVYPYFAYAASPKDVRLDYAQFTATSPVVHDRNLAYSNLLDAMVDAIYWAMEKVGVHGVSVVVSETGWPHKGGFGTSIELASTYNKNLVKYLRSGKGTPKRPNKPLQGFIFAAFDENQKAPGVEQYWGVFKPNEEPNYDLFN